MSSLLASAMIASSFFPALFSLGRRIIAFGVGQLPKRTRPMQVEHKLDQILRLLGAKDAAWRPEPTPDSSIRMQQAERHTRIVLKLDAVLKRLQAHPPRYYIANVPNVRDKTEM